MSLQTGVDTNIYFKGVKQKPVYQESQALEVWLQVDIPEGFAAAEGTDQEILGHQGAQLKEKIHSITVAWNSFHQHEFSCLLKCVCAHVSDPAVLVGGAYSQGGMVF